MLATDKSRYRFLPVLIEWSFNVVALIAVIEAFTVERCENNCLFFRRFRTDEVEVTWRSDS